MGALGYDAGQPFGDPNHFTRSTGDAEIDRFNQWMRAQPWWQQIRGNTTGDFTHQQDAALNQALRTNGINVPGDFHTDEGGNFNQKSRTKRNLIIAAAVGAGVLTAGAATGVIGGAAGAGSAGAGAAGAGAGATGAGAAGAAGALGSTAVGTGMVGGLTGIATASPGIAAGFGGAAAGGAAAAIPSLASRANTFGRIASNLSNNRAGARLAEDQANQGYDRTQIDAARLNLQAPGYRLGNAARGDLAAGLKPVSFSGSGRDLQMSGGVSPSLISDSTRQLGGQVSRDALLSQMNGPEFKPTPRPKPGALDKALNLGGTAAGLYGAWKGY